MSGDEGQLSSTDMEQTPVPRPKRSRAAHRTQMDKMADSVESIINQPVTTANLDTLSGIIKNFTKKLELLSILDEKILDTTPEADLEKDIIDSVTILSDYRIRLERYERFKSRNECVTNVLVMDYRKTKT